MGNLKPIDSALVKDVDYDLISPDTVGGEYIETIGAACENPDGYTSGSLFLGRENGVQHLYRATAAIAFGETIILDTNCAYTTVSGELEGKAEESEVTSLNEALANVDSVISNNGSMNLLPNDFTPIVTKGVTFTMESDKSIKANGTATGDISLVIRYEIGTESFVGKRVKLSGCPSGGNASKYSLYAHRAGTVDGSDGSQLDYGGGVTFDWLNNNSGTQAFVAIIIKEGIVCSNLTFKPMLTLASQPNSDYAHYVPYAKTNRELTESVTNVSKIGASSISDFFTASSDVAQVYDSSFIVKNGNMINIYLSIKLSASLGSSIVNLGNIAAGLRPYGAFYDIASKWNGDAITPTPLHVRTDGVIRLLNAVANTDYSFNIVYLI